MNYAPFVKAFLAGWLAGTVAVMALSSGRPAPDPIAFSVFAAVAWLLAELGTDVWEGIEG